MVLCQPIIQHIEKEKTGIQHRNMKKKLCRFFSFFFKLCKQTKSIQNDFMWIEKSFSRSQSIALFTRNNIKYEIEWSWRYYNNRVWRFLRAFIVQANSTKQRWNFNLCSRIVKVFTYIGRKRRWRRRQRRQRFILIVIRTCQFECCHIIDISNTSLSNNQSYSALI